MPRNNKVVFSLLSVRKSLMWMQSI